ncbi:hypothetical protein CCY99_00515 [Helicobacter sp. 16-1353]|uniref:LysE family translocator n=1 Tax=Helicobacter sp. 16-1353 TaxID=2004996 RepID=UPI000DCBF5F3|nr:LysE family translocator [Helicobacter sp. 16-1353]RAX55215.1 hypothetical protein CCY99_00515 [Helicobacter sp. 16-1353]
MIFIIAFLGAITPGPDILLVLQTTLRCGFKRAIITLLGIATGWIFYLTIVYFGFTKFFRTDLAQILLSAFGAVYLGYLAFLLLKKSGNKLDLDDKSSELGKSMESSVESSESAKPLESTESSKSTKSKEADNLSDTNPSGGYLKGLFVNLSNPKAILFFGVLYAPFMGKNLLSSLVLLFLGLVSAFMLVIIIGSFARKFITNHLFDIIDKVCGVVFLIFSLLLFWRIFELINS